MELSPTDPWTPYRGRLDFRRTFPHAHRDEWPAIDDWIRDEVPLSHRAAFRTWVAGRIGHQMSEAARRRAGHDLIERVDEFELYRLVDGGGMGVVYEAYDTCLDRTVAVKRVRPGLRLELVARFEAEVRLTARPPHPGIPAVYRFGHDTTGHPYMVMLFADGETLAERLHARAVAGGALEPLLDVFVRVCQTVGSRHTAAPLVVHGDLSPKNVKLDRNGEAVFVLDWGLSRAKGGQEADAGERAAGNRGGLSGTPGYMSPEQFGGEVTARTDVFQLGSILCELLTGQPAYAGTADERTARAARTDLVDAHARLANAGRHDLADLARRCLAVNPDERPPTATAVADEVLTMRVRAEEDRQRAERERERVEAARKVDRERGRRVFVTTVLFATLLVGGAVALWLTERAAGAERQAAVERQRKQYSEADRHKMYAFRIIATDFRGTHTEAERHLSQAVALLVPLAAERPDEPTYAHALAECRLYQGWLAFIDPKGERTGAAVALLRQAEDGFAAAQAGGWMPEAGFPNGTPAALERDDCRFLRGVVLLAASLSAAPADGRATEAFEVFDDLWNELPAAARPVGARPSQFALLTQLTRLVADQGVRFRSSYSPQAVAALRVMAQMAAEMEQSKIPWSVGPRPDHPRAVRAAGRLAASSGVSDAAVYNAACMCSLAAADDTASTSERTTRADAALDYLGRVRQAGYFLGNSERRGLETDKDLDSLRPDPRFQTLLARVRVGRALGGLTGGLGDFGLRSAE